MTRLCLVHLTRRFSRNGCTSCPMHTYSGDRNAVEKPRRGFVAGPSRSGDCTVEKVDSKSPDFKHKYTSKSLWLGNKRNAPRVSFQTISIASDIIQQSKRSGSKQKRLRTKIENRWRNFFSDPTQWWDNTPEKVNPKFPDFKHKHTQEALWLDNHLNPPWVESQMGLIPLGTLQMHAYSWAQRLRKSNKAKNFETTMKLFQQMQQEGINADRYVFVPVLKACAALQVLKVGRNIHRKVIESGCQSDLYVSSGLVDMYAKCGSIEDAWKVFNKMAMHDVVSWTAMIVGHVNCGQGLKALDLFKQMQQEGIEPDSVTYVTLLNACASIAALEEGKHVHTLIRQSGCEFEPHILNSLVNMYAKCGTVDEAWMIFQKIPKPDVIAWTAMIGGYAMHGLGNKAVALFERMVIEGILIDEVTLVCLLSACSHAGLVKEGMHYFNSMRSVYGVSPKTEHYTCMVDLLGRVGRLDDALEMVKAMPLNPDFGLWMSLLGACRIHGNVEMGEIVAKQVLQLNPKNAAGYVMLSNIFGAGGLSISS